MGLCKLSKNYLISILGYPGADSRGERQIKRAKSVRAKVYKTGWNSPWEDTFNGLVQESICVLASDWAQILRHCIFCAQSTISLFPVPFVSSFTESNVIFVVNNLCVFVNFVVNKLWIVQLWKSKSCSQISCTRAYTEISFLSRSFDRPTIEERFREMEPTKPRNQEIRQGYSRKKNILHEN